METVNNMEQIKTITPVSIASSPNLLDSVKEAFEDPHIKEGIMLSFSHLSKVEKNIFKNLIENPRVIIEPHYYKTKSKEDLEKMLEEFKLVDQIKLPFPNMIIFYGDQLRYSLETAVAKTVENSNKINSLSFYMLSEYQDKIQISLVMTDNHMKYVTHNTYIKLDVEKGISVDIPQNQPPIEAEHVNDLIKIFIVTVHRMTMSTNDFYISVPTQKEIKSNYKRIRKNKRPTVEFKIATITGKKTHTDPSSPHGTHASPRQHWRRGHWRTLSASGKKVWIAPMQVGDEANGKIIKTYAIGNYTLLESRT